jgi:hypothetical protein
MKPMGLLAIVVIVAGCHSKAPSRTQAPAATSKRAAEVVMDRPSDRTKAEDLKARLLARFLVADIALYNGEKAANAHGRQQIMDALDADIDEARELYRERVGPSRVHYFDECIVLLPLRVQKEWTVTTPEEAKELAEWIADDILILEAPEDYPAQVDAWRSKFRARVAPELHGVYERAVADLLKTPPPTPLLEMVAPGPAAIP